MGRQLIISVLLFFTISLSWAQEGSYYSSRIDQFRKGVELFDKEKYASARNVFDNFIESKDPESQKLLADANYYRALCAVKLYNYDAEFLLSHFLVEFPESPKTKEVYFVMGNFQYTKKRYSKAIKWYEKVDLFNLTQDEEEEYHFKLAYANFMRKKKDIASNHFLKIKDGESKYAAPAKYFYAHIAFSENKYETALKNFTALEEDDLFGAIVPYYIIQIYYFQNKNEAIIEYAPSLLDSSSTRRIPEISRILGEAYYKTERFAQSIPYLLKYKENSDNFSRADAYQLAYAYYKIADFTSATSVFRTISKRKDSISQNTYYHLADCYLKTDKKDEALLAFREASNLDVVPEVQEDAMYNYAKLSFELSYSPFNDAIQAINQYLKAYPNSRHHDEAYSYLSKVFLSTKNYRSAIETIEKIGNKSPEIIESYQRVTYYRGLEFYTDAKYKQAIALFNKSIQNSKYNLKFRALAKYWLAESYYKTEDYEKSFNDFNDFVLTSGAFGSEEYKDAHYNIGYALFKMHNYQEAIVWYRKYVEFTQTTKMMKIADAYNRIGDCYFISKNYNFAIDYYDKSIEMKRRNVDYAVFQKAFSLGLLKKYTEEIAQLKMLVQDFKNSNYIDDAIFETAEAYKFLDSNNAAIKNYNTIVTEYPYSKYRPKAYLQMGMLDYNTSRNDLALNSFKTLINEYPKSEESQKALLIMKNIYIDVNKVDEYIEFANNNSVETEVSKIEADSLTYISAENLYMSGDCDKSEPSLINYINKYPEGRYLLTAHYYKSDCEFIKKDYGKALDSYQYIISQKSNEYTEEALLKAAFINVSKENYTEAIPLYQKLLSNSTNNTSLNTAKIGLMRSYFKLKEYPKAITSAMKVLTISDESEALEREVHYIIGKSFFETNDMEGAYAEFMLIADQAKSKEGAEANYRMIQIEYQKKNYEKAIKLINTFKLSNSPHQLWVAKSFMIWSDIFVTKEDYFMAKATLESIIKYYPNQDDGIKKEAQEKVITIEELEMDEEELEEIEEIEIKMFDDDDNKLFLEEKEDSVPQFTPPPIEIKTDSIPSGDLQNEEIKKVEVKDEK